MKKILAILLTLALAAGLAACAQPAPAPAPAVTPESTPGGSAGTETPAAAPATDYPTKTIEIICPFGTGGDTDALCRAMAEVMTKELGVSVMVTNMTGGSGSVASNHVKDAAPDGYTVYFCHNTLVVNNICGISDFYHDAFTPAVLVAQSSALCVWTNSQFDSVEALVSYAKEHPGELNVGVCQGGITEIMAIAFCDAVGIDVNYIDCGDGNTMNVEMTAGRVAMGVNTFGTVKEYYQNGDLKPIAVMGQERLSMCPDTPTMAELGYDVAGDMYYGFYFPAGTPEEVVDVFNAAAETASKADSYTSVVTSYGYAPVCITKDEAAAVMDEIYTYYQQYKDLLA